MRLGKPTRLERQMHRQIVQGHAEAFMAERGYKPAPEPITCAACGSSRTFFDPGGGWCCVACGRSDSDE